MYDLNELELASVVGGTGHGPKFKISIKNASQTNAAIGYIYINNKKGEIENSTISNEFYQANYYNTPSN